MGATTPSQRQRRQQLLGCVDVVAIDYTACDRSLRDISDDRAALHAYNRLNIRRRVQYDLSSARPPLVSRFYCLVKSCSLTRVLKKQSRRCRFC